MGGFELIVGIVPVMLVGIFVMATSVRILREYERVLGQQELDDLLASRDKINAELTRI